MMLHSIEAIAAVTVGSVLVVLAPSTTTGGSYDGPRCRQVEAASGRGAPPVRASERVKRIEAAPPGTIVLVHDAASLHPHRARSSFSTRSATIRGACSRCRSRRYAEACRGRHGRVGKPCPAQACGAPRRPGLPLQAASQGPRAQDHGDRRIRSSRVLGRAAPRPGRNSNIKVTFAEDLASRS
jgi:hypothetical protein